MSTACRNCCHLINRHKNHAAPNIWYSLLCRATPLPPRFDPYSGEFKHDDEAFAFCRDVNKGDCPKFKAAPSAPTLVPMSKRFRLMSASDDGYEAGQKCRRDGGSLADYDAAEVREQATRDVAMCPFLPVMTRQEMIEDWLYGFWKGLCEEADDAV